MLFIAIHNAVKSTRVRMCVRAEIRHAEGRETLLCVHISLEEACSKDFVGPEKFQGIREQGA